MRLEACDGVTNLSEVLLHLVNEAVYGLVGLDLEHTLYLHDSIIHICFYQIHIYSDWKQLGFWQYLLHVGVILLHQHIHGSSVLLSHLGDSL